MQHKTIVRTCLGLVIVGVMSGLAALCAMQHRTISTLLEQQRALEAQLSARVPAREEPTAAAPGADHQAELERLREDNKDLLRLRAEVTQLRKQVAELEVLRAANAQLLQAMQSAATLPGTQAALVTSARKMGAILGVAVRPPASGQPGAEITGVDATSPVATSGLAAGDIIYAVDGRPVRAPADLQAYLLTRKPGEMVMVDVLRANSSMRFQVQTRAWPE